MNIDTCSESSVDVVLGLLEAHLTRMSESGHPAAADQGLLSELGHSRRVLRVIDAPDLVARHLAARYASEASQTGWVPFLLPWPLMPAGDLETPVRLALQADDEAWETFVSAWADRSIHPVFIAYARDEDRSFLPLAAQGPLGRLESDGKPCTLVVLHENPQTAARWTRDLEAAYPSWHRQKESASPVPVPRIGAPESFDPAVMGFRPFDGDTSTLKSPGTPAGLIDHLMEWRTPDMRDPLSLLLNHRNPMLLAGLPGSGKTTLVGMAINEWLKTGRTKVRRRAMRAIATDVANGLVHADDFLAWLDKYPGEHVWLVLEDLDTLHPHQGFLHEEDASMGAFIDGIVERIHRSKGRLRLTVTSRYDDLMGPWAWVRRAGKHNLEVVPCQIDARGPHPHAELPVPWAVALARGSVDRIEQHPDFLNMLDLAITLDCRKGMQPEIRREAMRSLATSLLDGSPSLAKETADRLRPAVGWSSFLTVSESGQEVRFRLPWMQHALAMQAALDGHATDRLDSFGWRNAMLLLAEEHPWRSSPALWPDNVTNAVLLHDKKLRCGYGNYESLSAYLGDTPHLVWLEAFRSYYHEADYASVVKLLLPKAVYFLQNSFADLSDVEPDLLAILVSCLADLHLDREAVALARVLRKRTARAGRRGAAWYALGGALGRIRLRLGWNEEEVDAMLEALMLFQQKLEYHQAEDMRDDVARDHNDILLALALLADREPDGLRKLVDRHRDIVAYHENLEDHGPSVSISRSYTDRNLSYALLCCAKDPSGIGAGPAADAIRSVIDEAIRHEEELAAEVDHAGDVGLLGTLRLHRALDRWARGLREAAVEDARRARFCFVKSDYRLEAWLASRMFPAEAGDLPVTLDSYLEHRRSVQKSLRRIAVPLGGTSKGDPDFPAWPAGDEKWPGWLLGQLLL